MMYQILRLRDVGHQWLIPVILATWEAEIMKIEVWGQTGQIVHETLISKITRAKWTGGEPWVVEHLLWKPKAPSSNPSPTKKKNWGESLLHLCNPSTRRLGQEYHKLEVSLGYTARLSQKNTVCMWEGFKRIKPEITPLHPCEG
jgi:hypothetical protein